MVEIRFHGRGGQGAVVASKVLAVALFNEGWQVQSFPAFGAERRGAPVAAFTRLDRGPIVIRNFIYTPDMVVVLDPTLLGSVDIVAGLKPGGWLVINTEAGPDKFKNLGPFPLALVDAGRLAVEHGLGTPTAPIVNTAIVGALAKATGLVGLDSLTEAIKETVPGDWRANAAACAAAHDHTRIYQEAGR